MFLRPYALDIYVVRLIGRASQQANDGPIPSRKAWRDDISLAGSALNGRPVIVPLVSIGFTGLELIAVSGDNRCERTGVHCYSQWR